MCTGDCTLRLASLPLERPEAIKLTLSTFEYHALLGMHPPKKIPQLCRPCARKHELIHIYIIYCSQVLNAIPIGLRIAKALLFRVSSFLTAKFHKNLERRCADPHLPSSGTITTQCHKSVALLYCWAVCGASLPKCISIANGSMCGQATHRR